MTTSKNGELFLPDGDCADMDACIALFEQIDSQVRRIQTINDDDGLDKLYYRREDGEWAAKRR